MLAWSAAQKPAAPTSDSAATLSRDWKRLTTPNLTVVGNARDSDLRRAGEEIERFRQAVASLSSALRLDSPVPTLVVVFRDNNSFTPYKPRQRGKVLDNVAGYFLGLPQVNYLVMAPSDNREFTYRVTFHEYTHYIVRRNFKRLPLWLNEGLADFYGTYAGSEKDGRTIIGRPIDGYVATLTTATVAPLAKFVSPTASAELFRDIHGTWRYYAQSWALTHFLIVGNNGVRRAQLGRFIAEVERGVSTERAFLDVFGPDLSGLDRELRDYIRQFQLPGIQLPRLALTLETAPEPLREADALQMQADLLVSYGAFDMADERLGRALTLDRGHMAARLTRARLRLAQDRHADALDIAEAPDLVESSDFGAHFVRAEALRSAARYEDAAAAYKRAIELHGDSPHSHYGLSLAQLAAGDPLAAASFTRCLNLSPDPGWYAGRQIEALRLGIDRFVVSDATNYVRLAGWQGTEAIYMMFPAALTNLRNSERAQAMEILDDIERHVELKSWQSVLVGLLRGTVTPEAAIARAKDDDGLLTEAHAYSGILASVEGRRDDALRHLQWVKDRGRKDFREYLFATGELSRLGVK
jgi:tetratricopeptide (TPR) repeat protein